MTDMLVAFWSKMVAPFVRLWCAVTGRSSYALARAMMWAVPVFIGADQVVWMSERHVGTGVALMVVGGLMAVLVVVFWSWVALRECRFLRALERDMEQANGTLPMSALKAERGARLCGWVLVVWPVVWAAIWWGQFHRDAFFLIGSCLYLLSGIVAVHHRPPGKSVVRRVVEAARRTVDRAKAALPSPSPEPMPVRVPATRGW